MTDIPLVVVRAASATSIAASPALQTVFGTVPEAVIPASQVYLLFNDNSKFSVNTSDGTHLEGRTYAHDLLDAFVAGGGTIE